MPRATVRIRGFIAIKHMEIETKASQGQPPPRIQRVAVEMAYQEVSFLPTVVSHEHLAGKGAQSCAVYATRSLQHLGTNGTMAVGLATPLSALQVSYYILSRTSSTSPHVPFSRAGPGIFNTVHSPY